MNQMEIFKNPEFGSIRVIEENGKYLFCGTDVAAALGYSNSRDAIIRHCRYVVKRDAPHPQSPDRKISMTFIPEGDLYRLIVHSKLPSAEQFEQWVFDEVLPTIRKHGAYTNAKHPQRNYSCKTYNAFGKNHCTQHRIDYDTLYSHVLRKIRECARAALMDGEAVADRLTNTCEAEQREQREAMERSLTRDEERIEVLDKMVMRLYEDMIAGRISEQNFNTMLEKTQTEQTELKTKVSEGRKRLSDEVQLANDAKQWVEAIQEYANITELDAATLNRLIKEIVVHERIDEDKTRHISIEIHFNLKPIPEVEQVTA